MSQGYFILKFSDRSSAKIDNHFTLNQVTRLNFKRGVGSNKKLFITIDLILESANA